MFNPKLSPIQLTDPQREWLTSETQRTGNSQASIIRTLVQEKADKQEAKKEQRKWPESGQ